MQKLKISNIYSVRERNAPVARVTRGPHQTLLELQLCESNYLWFFDFNRIFNFSKISSKIILASEFVPTFMDKVRTTVSTQWQYNDTKAEFTSPGSPVRFAWYLSVMLHSDGSAKLCFMHTAGKYITELVIWERPALFSGVIHSGFSTDRKTDLPKIFI